MGMDSWFWDLQQRAVLGLLRGCGKVKEMDRDCENVADALAVLNTVPRIELNHCSCVPLD